MTSNPEIVKITFRASASQKEEIAVLAKKAGLSQQDYLLKAALGQLALTHTLPANGSGVALDSVLSAGTKYSAGTKLKGAEADKVLLNSKVDGDVKGQPKLALAYGMLWLIGKTPNGSQKVLEALAEVPEPLQCSRKGKDATPNELWKALPNWQQFAHLDGFGSLPDKQQRRYADCCFGNDIAYLKSELMDAQEEIEALSHTLPANGCEASLELVIGAGSVANAGIAISDSPQVETEPVVEQIAVVEETAPQCQQVVLPLHESSSVATATPQGLKIKDMVELYPLLANGSTYGNACKDGGKDEGWKAPDGSVWRYSGPQGKPAKVWSKVS